jgi:hypothetical protein
MWMEDCRTARQVQNRNHRDRAGTAEQSTYGRTGLGTA